MESSPAAAGRLGRGAGGADNHSGMLLSVLARTGAPLRPRPCEDAGPPALKGRALKRPVEDVAAARGAGRRAPSGAARRSGRAEEGGGKGGWVWVGAWVWGER